MFKIKKGKALMLLVAATAFAAAIAYDKKNNENLEENQEDEFVENTIEVEEE